MTFHNVTVRKASEKLPFTSTQSFFSCDGTNCGNRADGYEGEAHPPKTWAVLKIKGQVYHTCTNACRINVLAWLDDGKKGLGK